MNALDTIQPFSAVTGLFKGALDKAKRAHAKAVANVTECEERIKNLEAELAASRKAYSDAIDSADEGAAKDAVSWQGSLQLKIDIARARLKRCEVSASQSYDEWVSERLKASASATDWANVRKRMTPLVKRLVAARRELHATVSEIRALGDELRNESAIEKQLRRVTGDFVALNLDHLLGLVNDEVSRSCEGDLPAPMLAPWIEVHAGDEARSKRTILLLQKSDLSWAARGGPERAANLLANGPEGRISAP